MNYLNRRNVMKTAGATTTLLAIVLTLLTDSAAGSDKEKRSSVDLEVVEPALASPDEPFAKEFSLKQAADYLDAAALHWTRTQECATCHTNVPHLLARPVLSKLYPPTGEVRAAFEQWSDNWDELAKGKTSISAVVRASSLTINDMMMTGTLQLYGPQTDILRVPHRWMAHAIRESSVNCRTISVRSPVSSKIFC